MAERRQTENVLSGCTGFDKKYFPTIITSPANKNFLSDRLLEEEEGQQRQKIFFSGLFKSIFVTTGKK